MTLTDNELINTFQVCSQPSILWPSILPSCIRFCSVPPFPSSTSSHSQGEGFFYNSLTMTRTGSLWSREEMKNIGILLEMIHGPLSSFLADVLFITTWQLSLLRPLEFHSVCSVWVKFEAGRPLKAVELIKLFKGANFKTIFRSSKERLIAFSSLAPPGDQTSLYTIFKELLQ